MQTSSGGRFKPVRQAAPTTVPTPASAANGGLQEGSVIEHQRFGVGRVVKIEGSGENQKATVEFKNTGTKQLLLKYARYTVIS